jgi:phospholipid/cholesterol/gamma-HCH transport system permease protein
MFVLPLLTIIADFVGLIGGYVIAVPLLSLTTGAQFWNTAYRALEYNDLAQGLMKPVIFAYVIALVGCFYGIRTTGGTQGVGRSTTQAVVVASVWIFILTNFVTRVFVSL